MKSSGLPKYPGWGDNPSFEEVMAQLKSMFNAETYNKIAKAIGEKIDNT